MAGVSLKARVLWRVPVDGGPPTNGVSLTYYANRIKMQNYPVVVKYGNNSAIVETTFVIRYISGRLLNYSTVRVELFYNSLTHRVVIDGDHHDITTVQVRSYKSFNPFWTVSVKVLYP